MSVLVMIGLGLLVFGAFCEYVAQDKHRRICSEPEAKWVNRETRMDYPEGAGRIVEKTLAQMVFGGTNNRLHSLQYRQDYLVPLENSDTRPVTVEERARLEDWYARAYQVYDTYSALRSISTFCLIVGCLITIVMIASKYMLVSPGQ